jgi:antitoxin component HigA of HigAB toxin-antitoxin module
MTICHSQTDGEQDYLDALSILIQRYDEEYFPMPDDASHLENLKFLLSENKMNIVDLGNLLGNRGLASLILNRKRKLSKANIRARPIDSR